MIAARDGGTRAELAPIDLPEFGLPDATPQIPTSTYARRLARLRDCAGARRIDRLVIYADRLVDELRTLVGPTGAVENATDLLIDAQDGLRVINDVDQLAAMEAAPCRTSQGVKNLIRGLEPGLTERAAVRFLEWDGSPLACHVMLTAGPGSHSAMRRVR